MLERFLRWLGYGLCHQLPERSFFGGGLQAPVCARDAGIYLGFTISMLVLAALYRPRRPRGLPGASVWAFILLAAAFMGWDGVTSYAGLRESSNLLRLMSGLGVGFSAAAIIVPMLNDVVWMRPDAGRILEPGWRLGLWLSALPVSAALLWFGGPVLGAVYPLLIATSIIVTLAAINLVIVGMLPAFDRRAARARDLLAPAALSILAAFAEIWGAGLLRNVLVRLVGGA